MPAKKTGAATVGAYVDEAAGRVVVYVEYGGRKLPVAQASLDHAVSLDFNPDASGNGDDDNGKGGSE